MDTLGVGVGSPVLEEVEDIGAPTPERPSPLDHSGIIGEMGDLDEVFELLLGRLFGPQSVAVGP